MSLLLETRATTASVHHCLRLQRLRPAERATRLGDRLRQRMILISVASRRIAPIRATARRAISGVPLAAAGGRDVVDHRASRLARRSAWRRTRCDTASVRIACADASDQTRSAPADICSHFGTDYRDWATLVSIAPVESRRVLSSLFCRARARRSTLHGGHWLNCDYDVFLRICVLLLCSDTAATSRLSIPRRAVHCRGASYWRGSALTGVRRLPWARLPRGRHAVCGAAGVRHARFSRHATLRSRCWFARRPLSHHDPPLRGLDVTRRTDYCSHTARCVIDHAWGDFASLAESDATQLQIAARSPRARHAPALTLLRDALAGHHGGIGAGLARCERQTSVRRSHHALHRCAAITRTLASPLACLARSCANVSLRRTRELTGATVAHARQSRTHATTLRATALLSHRAALSCCYSQRQAFARCAAPPRCGLAHALRASRCVHHERTF